MSNVGEALSLLQLAAAHSQRYPPLPPPRPLVLPPLTPTGPQSQTVDPSAPPSPYGYGYEEWQTQPNLGYQDEPEQPENPQIKDIYRLFLNQQLQHSGVPPPIKKGQYYFWDDDPEI